MSNKIFVEILGTDGRVVSRQGFNHLPLRIGRAYDNDVILDDAYAAAHHGLVEENQLDELILKDLETLNGIRHQHQRERDFVVDGNKAYQLGRTRLRIRRDTHPLAPELADTINHRWEGWRPALIGSLLLVAFGLLSTWLADLAQQDMSRYLLETVKTLVFAISWAGAWALLGRMFTGHARFGRQLFITCVTLVILGLWEQLTSLLAFALDWPWLSGYHSHETLVIIAIALYFQLVTAGHKHPKRLQAYLTGLALLSSAIIFTKQYQASNHFADDLYMSRLYPPSLRISANQSLPEFLDEMRAQQAIADKNRKPNPEKD